MFFVVFSSCESFWQFTCRLAKMLLLFWFFGVKFTVRVVIFVVGRVLIFNLHSSCKKEKKKRKALTLDAIFFKDKLFFLNVAFIAL